ncbi:MAG: lipid biosynthesis B12-binding/radical SAM protein, partial [Holophaga sp.]|nr:lipid biosynthesis B12-binding/radical SAM protein [Holophaga sp.]
MSRILLVSSNTTIDPFPVYPLGMAVVASALASAGHTVDQFDFLMEGESEDAFRNRIKGFEPEFVCMSMRNLDNCDSLTATAYPVVAKRLVDLVREVRAVPVIVGGPAFSILPEELLAFTGADYGIVGEGERLVCELIQDLSQGRSSPRILRNQALVLGQDMISPLYSADMVSYYVEQSGMINLQSKRGCAHGCIYCSYPSLEGKRYRLREPGAVVDDMERAKQEHGVDTFFFTDAVFNDDGGHYLQVVEEILRRDSAFRWAC